MLLPVAPLVAAALAAVPVADFELPDAAGKSVRLSAFAANRPCVVVFLGVDCPMARLYAARLNALAGRFPAGSVAVLAIDPHRGDDLPAMAAFAREHSLAFPFLKDADSRVTARFGAIRTPQAFVLDAGRRVRYRGRIDDQYAAGGKNRGTPTREDLVEAVREVLAGKPVSVPGTECTGCRISRPRAPAAPGVTYSRDIAPILRAHCAPCHRPGEVGPFALLSYADARDHAATVAEVVANGTMPPWHAAPGALRFRNERRLTDAQKRLIAEWVRAGCPEGDPLADDSDGPPAAGWRIGTPDAVYAIPTEFRVPAEGIIEYKHFIIDPGLTGEAWVRAAEVRPGNRRVVHHVSVFLRPPGSTDPNELFETGALGSFNLIAFTPGSDPVRFPDGTAKRIPAGWRLHVVVHYTAVGTPQTDRTELAVQFLAPREVRREVATKLLVDTDFAIPPGAAAHRVERTWAADRDYLLLAMLPHMHLRGKSFRYAAKYPDGTSEVLLDVPAYDFNWQHRYELAEPKRLPAGTVVRCTAVYDNSAANPFNPDPGATVRAGPQSTDEMFNGYLDIVLADQDMPAERAAVESRRERSRWLLAGSALVAGLWGARLWRGRRAGPVTATPA